MCAKHLGREYLGLGAMRQLCNSETKRRGLRFFNELLGADEGRFIHLLAVLAKELHRFSVYDDEETGGEAVEPSFPFTAILVAPGGPGAGVFGHHNTVRIDGLTAHLSVWRKANNIVIAVLIDAGNLAAAERLFDLRAVEQLAFFRGQGLPMGHIARSDGEDCDKGREDEGAHHTTFQGPTWLDIPATLLSIVDNLQPV